MVVTLKSFMSKFLPVVTVEAARIVHNHFGQSRRRSCKALDLPALFAAGRATPSFFIHDLAPFLVVEVVNVPVPGRLNDPEKKLGILIGHVVALLREGGDGVEFGLNSLAKVHHFSFPNVPDFAWIAIKKSSAVARLVISRHSPLFLSS
jgi:hypothetical protein